MIGEFGKKQYEFSDSFEGTKAVLIWESEEGRLDNDDFEMMLDEADIHFEVLLGV